MRLIAATVVLAAGLAGVYAAKALEATRRDAPIQVRSAWIREMPPGSTTASAYFDITSRGPSRVVLRSGSSPAARVVEFHGSAVVHGVAQMRKLEKGVPLPGGSWVRFSPGTRHLMLIDVPKRLVAGDTVDVTLVFDGARPVDLKVPVVPLTGQAPEPVHNGH